MGRPYSQDLRERVMAAVDGGMRVYAAAPVFRVSVSYIYKALSRRTKTGETTARAELKTWLVRSMTRLGSAASALTVAASTRTAAIMCQ